jgi:GTP-binding protein
MKFEKAYFLKSCRKPKDFPSYPHPEFAFFGRSNVGKSSLINMILGQKNLVKTGSRPGVTQMINFFVVEDSMSFVDLPGYGYAKVPLEIKKGFLPMIKDYVDNRDNLKLALLLVDIRRVPDDFELEILGHLTGKKIPVAVILTKCDKLSGNQKSASLKKISAALGIDSENFFITSVKSGAGKRELRKLILDYAREARENS